MLRGPASVGCMEPTNTTHAPTPDDYAAFINEQLAAELRERREALGISAYALAKHARVTDQTILNMEQGNNSPTVTTLALVCVRLGTTLTELVTAAEARPRSPKRFG